MENRAILEGLLFVVGDDGLNIEQIKDVFQIDEEEAKNLIFDLKNSYNNPDRGLRIDFLGNKIKLTTKPEHKAYYQKLILNPETNVLSQAALETLAIIAYNEPVTRMQIDELRGVSSDYTLRKLLAKGLLKEAGKSTMPGRPNLYATTHEFLDYFGLATLEDLPPLEELETRSDETELFTSIYKEDGVVNE